ncbi:hypothetical protein ACS0TY_018490 [Phlomoides rotata]
MASAYSAFMVTGGSIANVGSQIFAKRSGKSLIDYDIALLSEPCMLLGVSCGVICNLMFPEWLITMIFAVFLAFCTFKTCKSGVSFWKLESEGGRINGCLKMENEEAGESTKMPLLSVDEGKFEIPLMKLGMLVLIWFSFFILYLLRGNRYGQCTNQVSRFVGNYRYRSLWDRILDNFIHSNSSGNYLHHMDLALQKESKQYCC